MRNRVVRLWATLLTVLGVVAIAAGLAGGVVVTRLLGVSALAVHPALIGVPLTLVGVVAGLLLGALAGAPLVAMGQGLRLLLEQRARLARIERRLRAPAAAPPASPAEGSHSLADRLRVRP